MIFDEDAEEEAFRQEEQVDELLNALYDVLYQACADENGQGDSRAETAYAKGLRLLAEYGLFKIEKEHGRRVIGRFVGEAPTIPPESEEGKILNEMAKEIKR